MAKPSINVDVETRFLPEQSNAGEHVYTFSYTITISNTGGVPAQLISRHWQIADESGRKQEVRGLGVIGQQPLLAPGESFRYTSGCRLQAPSGTMRGSYFFVTDAGDRFDVPIAMFALEASETALTPRVLH
ncbi:MAG: Co2+/Mg2+ efflux protein ApaG [Variovorax sp.]